MPDDRRDREATDRTEIRHVIAKSVIARDSGLWKELAECYHPDATLTTSWFTGTPAEFVKGSQEMKIVRHEGESQKHMTGNYWIEIRGDRAVAECDLILYQRRIIDGIELDFTTWSRRIHRLARRDGTWRISGQTVVYEKDRMDPHNPNDLPDGFYESLDLGRFPPQIRYHCWRNETVGYPPSKNICIIGSEREKEVREELRLWMEDA